MKRLEDAGLQLLFVGFRNAAHYDDLHREVKMRVAPLPRVYGLETRLRPWGWPNNGLALMDQGDARPLDDGRVLLAGCACGCHNYVAACSLKSRLMQVNVAVGTPSMVMFPGLAEVT